MKKQIAGAALICCAWVPPARAAKPFALTAAAPDVAGTITSSFDGVESTADMRFRAPDKLRIEAHPNAEAATDGQVLLATGTSTQLFNPATRRLVRLPYNLALRPWLDTSLIGGGPANMAIYGVVPGALNGFYDQTDAAPKVSLLARPDAGSLVQDYIRSGGGPGNEFYAVWKRRISAGPPSLRLTLTRGQLSSVEQLGPAGAPELSAKIEFGADGLPRVATVFGAANGERGKFDYKLAAATAPLGAEAFALGTDAEGQIVEDSQLLPLNDYGAPTDAAGHFNLGMALAAHLENFGAAFAQWDQAAALEPTATAPLLATYNAAVRTRQIARAARVLNALGKILGEDSFAVATRRADLAARQRDWAASAASLAVAQNAQPQNLSVTLLRARVLQVLGKVDESRALLLQIVKSKSPQPVAQAAAAEAIALGAWSGANATEVADTLALLPQDTQWQRLARLELAAWSGDKVPVAELSSPLALGSAAQALEIAGDDAAAAKLWERLAVDPRNEPLAALHLATLSARAGDDTSSLRAFKVELAALDNEGDRRGATSALAEAWRKSFHGDELKAELKSRAISTANSEADTMAWIAFLDSDGTLADVGAATRAAADRFDSSAFWHSRLAEQLLAERQALSDTRDTERAALLKQAQEEVQRAIDLAPDQPYYAMQLALASLQRAAEASVIVQPEIVLARQKAATDALDASMRAWPNDADVALLVALGRQQLGGRPTPSSINGIEQALRQGLPGRESATGDRHETVFFARQVIALSWRKLKRWDKASAAYQQLLLASRTANEQLGIGLNYLSMLDEQANKMPSANLDSVAAVFENAVAQPWSYAESQMLLQNYIDYEVRDQPRALALVSLLAVGDSAQKVAAAQLSTSLAKAATRAADAPGAPAVADRMRRAAETANGAALAKLADVATGADKTVAGRALAGLAERAAETKDDAGASAYLRQAIDLEPQDLLLRLALIRALFATGNKTEAIAARDDALRQVPRNGSNLQELSLVSTRLGLIPDAVHLATLAQRALQFEPSASPAQVEIASFVLARALEANQQKEQAGEVYKQLSAPQWGPADRAAALIDWEAQLRAAATPDEADVVHAQLVALHVKRTDLAQARGLLANLGG